MPGPAGEGGGGGRLVTHLLAWGNDLGLFAEQIDPASQEQLGNFPQAFSHVALVNAAWRRTDCTSGQDLDDVQ